VLRDVLDVIRRFEPQVIVSVFSGTPRDGHGQHQVAGLVARQAFEALRDSSWGPVKLYRSLYFDTASATLRLDAGVLEPVQGRSYHQIAMAAGASTARRTKASSSNRGRGSRGSCLSSGETRDGDEGRRRLFAGVDTVFRANRATAWLIDSARAQLTPTRPDAIVPLLGRALRELGDADSAQQSMLQEALAAAAGVVIDGFADDGVVIPVSACRWRRSVWNAGDAGVTLEGIELGTPRDGKSSGWIP